MAKHAMIYEYDVIVVGAGHAGVEAAAAAARVGARAVLLTTNLDTIARMSCNPAIGGVGKGQIVREVDALGGVMGRAIDATGIQFRMLNRRKGPAMHGPRAQADRVGYQEFVKLELESTPGLALRQETVESLIVQPPEPGEELPRVIGVRVTGDAEYRGGAVILCTGTFMAGVLHVGDSAHEGGRMGEAAVTGISASLREVGLDVARFKTGTPPRVNGRTIDYSKTERQDGDDPPEPFSFLTDRLDVEQIPCWITHTNPRVHDLVHANLDRAPMYTGQITSTGPRYCPSFETKVVRFADKTSHQLFLEPEGRRTHEVYLGGFATSLPRDVQDEMIREIAGLANAEILRYGYAIEYDFVPPQQVTTTLQAKCAGGLYLAGQVNGTTGYEEAAAQGLVAGTSAARSLAGKEPLRLDRSSSYIGVMIDDLVTCGVDEPYRMFTSRAEYRLLLRGDNADRRLTPIGIEHGLVGPERGARLQKKLTEIARVRKFLEETNNASGSLEKWLRRPDATWEELARTCPALADVEQEVARAVTYDVKYAGYIARQEAEIARTKKLATTRIPEDFDYHGINHLRMEAREQLSRIRPIDVAQASRVRGITPADIAVLMATLHGR